MADFKISCPYLVSNGELKEWVQQVAGLCEPDQIRWCDGSKAEYTEMCEKLVEKGTFIRLDEKKRPGSFACFSDPVM